MTVTYEASAWPLFPIGIIFGFAMRVAFRRTSNLTAIARAQSKIVAHLLELRLFPGEPAVLWSAQKNLMRANVRLISLLVRPALILSAPAFLLLTQLEAIYGRAALQVGKQAVITACLKGPQTATLETPGTIGEDHPAVRIEALNQVSWRVVALSPFSGAIRIRVGNTTAAKSIVAGERPAYKSGIRTRDLARFLLNPAEPRLPDGPLRSIEVRYPPARIGWFGIRLPWLVWFSFLSLTGALVFPNRFDPGSV